MTVLLIEHGESRRSRRWCRHYRQWFERQQQSVLTLTVGSSLGVDVLTLHRYLERANEVIILAGDGTLHWLINQLTPEQAQRLILSVIPCGTGNDFCRDLGLLKAGWRMQQEEQLRFRHVDVGEVNGVRFVNAASSGLTADLVQQQSPAMKSWFGRYSYLLGVLWWWLRYQPQDNQDSVLQSLLIGRYLGGGIKLAPDANRMNGQLTRVRVATASKWQLLGVLLSVLRGRHTRHPLVTLESAEDFVQNAGALEIDGEHYQQPLQTKASVLQRFLKVRVIR